MNHTDILWSCVLLTSSSSLQYSYPCMTEWINCACSNFYYFLFKNLLLLLFLIMIFIFPVIAGLQCLVNFLSEKQAALSVVVKQFSFRTLFIKEVIHSSECLHILTQSFCLFVFLFCFLGSHLRHMEVPRLGVESELQLPVYTTATATWYSSCICDLHHNSQQYWILNPLIEARDWTASSWILVGFVTAKPQQECLYIFFFRFFSLMVYYRILSTVPCAIE